MLRARRHRGLRRRRPGRRHGSGRRAGGRRGPEEEEPPPPDLGPPRRVFAKRFVANVRNAPSRDAMRIGYLRGGATLMTRTTRPVGEEGCAAGWFELEHGGFVCNGRDVTVFDGDRLPEARAAQPDRGADMPYQYAYARRDNVAVYRGLPTDDEAAEFEGYRIPGREPPADRGSLPTPGRRRRRSRTAPRRLRPASVATRLRAARRWARSRARPARRAQNLRRGKRSRPPQPKKRNPTLARRHCAACAATDTPS